MEENGYVDTHGEFYAVYAYGQGVYGGTLARGFKPYEAQMSFPRARVFLFAHQGPLGIQRIVKS